MSLEILPQSGGKAKKLVVLLHGLGSNGEDLLGLVPYIAPEIKDAHFYSPNGIQKCDMGPFGYQWFSLRERDPDFLIQELDESSPIVLDMIENKLNELNLTFDNLILIGFSQGTMLALYLTAISEFKIKSTVGFSGTFLPPREIKNTQTPILLVHGANDEVVPYSNLSHSKARLESAGITKIQTHSIEGLGHSIDLEGLKVATKFIKTAY